MKWPNVKEYLKTKVLQFGDARLMIDYETEASYTYREFDAATDRMASDFCKLGVKRGDRIAFLHPNHTDLLLGYFAAIKADAVAVPVNPMYTAREITHILNDSTASTLISTDSFYEEIRVVKEKAPSISNIIMKKEGQSLREAVAAMPGAHTPEYSTKSNADDLAMIFYTSGTTGRPKGVMISHRNITFGAGNMAQSYGLTTSDVAVVCLPLNHIFANASPFWGTLASGGSAVVMERFQSDPVFDVISRYGVTWFAGVPTMFNYLISSFDENSRNVSSLRMGLSGAASLSVEHLKAFVAPKPGKTLEEKELEEFCLENLTRYKAPRTF
ncbi:MAG: long-chain fatty acid--CoA ligase, partial [Desulfobacteraceae bacterium]|nr:long-chain fatty acid--CoA ligase [Desulfobacteraceae bacterium]